MERIGIAGLAQSGKSSLFNALTHAGAATGAGSYGQREANLGVASVPDLRLEVLAELENSKQIVRTQIEFADVAGLVAGSSRGEGLGNAFLGKLREVDAIVCVVRAFEASEVPHPDGSVDAARDIATLVTELCLADLESAEKAVDRYRRSAKSGDADQRRYFEEAERIVEALENSIPISEAGGLPIPPDMFLVTEKPMIWALNIGEDQIGEAEEIENRIRPLVAAGGNEPEVVAVCVQVEAEAADLSDEDRDEFLAAYGLGEGAVPKLIRAVYGSLDLLTFLTAGEPETRAWTAIRGSKAPQAAGRIHSDMERGFIRMEVVGYDDLVNVGAWKGAKEAGVLRIEGKDYVVQEGDVVHIRFNV